MGTARPSVTKRQREQLKRERQLKKVEKRATRKPGEGPMDEEFELLTGPSLEPIE